MVTPVPASTALLRADRSLVAAREIGHPHSLEEDGETAVSGTMMLDLVGSRPW